MTPSEMKKMVKDFILKEFLPGESEDALTDDVRLVSDGILDSMSTLRLVSFLEETFNVQIEAHKIDTEHLDTLDQVIDTVQSYSNK